VIYFILSQVIKLTGEAEGPAQGRRGLKGVRQDDEPGCEVTWGLFIYGSRI